MKTRLIERGVYLKSIHGSYHLNCRPRYYKLLTHLDFMAIMRGHWRKSNIFNSKSTWWSVCELLKLRNHVHNLEWPSQ